MIAYLFRCLFFLMILFTGLLYTSNFPKRSHYLPRVIATTAFGILVSSFWAALFGGSPQPLLLYLLYQAAGFLGQFLIALFCVYLCVQMHLWTCLYMGTLFWFTQQASCSLTCIFTGENFSTYQGIATSIGTLLAVALLLYGLLIRKVDASVLERIHSRTVFPSWVLMLLACLLLNSYASYCGNTGGAYYFALLLIDTVVLFYQYSIYRTLGLERENEAIHLLLEQSGKQYQISKQNMEQVNIKCHDLRHQIRVFRSEGRIDESVLKDMQKAVDAYDTIIKTGNPALDVLLTEKARCAAASRSDLPAWQMVVDCFIWNRQTYMHCLVMRWKMQSRQPNSLATPIRNRLHLPFGQRKVSARYICKTIQRNPCGWKTACLLPESRIRQTTVSASAACSCLQKNTVES